MLIGQPVSHKQANSCLWCTEYTNLRIPVHQWYSRCMWTLVHAFLTSCMDFGNFLWYGIHDDERFVLWSFIFQLVTSLEKGIYVSDSIGLCVSDQHYSKHEGNIGEIMCLNEGGLRSPTALSSLCCFLCSSITLFFFKCVMHCFTGHLEFLLNLVTSCITACITWIWMTSMFQLLEKTVCCREKERMWRDQSVDEGYQESHVLQCSVIWR